MYFYSWKYIKAYIHDCTSNIHVMYMYMTCLRSHYNQYNIARVNSLYVCISYYMYACYSYECHRLILFPSCIAYHHIVLATVHWVLLLWLVVVVSTIDRCLLHARPVRCHGGNETVDRKIFYIKHTTCTYCT